MRKHERFIFQHFSLGWDGLFLTPELSLKHNTLKKLTLTMHKKKILSVRGNTKQHKTNTNITKRNKT